MTVRDDYAHPRTDAARAEVDATQERAAWWPAAVLAVVAAGFYAIHLNLPGFFDNEGRYAEVARQMLLRGDWITPRLDDTLFLNKPPLAYWLTAGAFELFGRNEWARVLPVTAIAVTLFATVRLGAVLYGEATGLIAGLLAATTFGVVLEARTLRPDCLLMATITTALWCFARAHRADHRRRTRWLIGMYLALALGVMAKGLVPVVIAAPAIGWTVWSADGWEGVRRLRPLLGLAVVAAIVLPWHLAVAWTHEGFAWDYVVNQHLLFFLDKKLPRDSEGDGLFFFWSAYGLRALPWILVLPFAIGRGPALPWIWLATVLGFFSLAPSRLEHYALPALPATALLAAQSVDRLRRGEIGRTGWTYLLGIGALIGVAGVTLLLAGSRVLAGADWIEQAPALVDLVRPAGGVLLVLGLVLAGTAARRAATAFTGALAAGTLAMAAIVVRALIAAEPLFSWRGVAAAIDERLPAGTEVVFESPEEYQLVGGLAFYLDRHVTLLDFPNFVPPTYLAQHFRSMFLPRDRFAERWRSGEPLAFVSDPQRRRDSPDGITPGPSHVVAHLGDRWVLTNFAPTSAR